MRTMRTMTAKLLLVDAIFLLLNLQFAHASFSMKIPSGVEECFGLKIPENGAKAVVRYVRKSHFHIIGVLQLNTLTIFWNILERDTFDDCW